MQASKLSPRARPTNHSNLPLIHISVETLSQERMEQAKWPAPLKNAAFSLPSICLHEYQNINSISGKTMGIYSDDRQGKGSVLSISCSLFYYLFPKTTRYGSPPDIPMHLHPAHGMLHSPCIYLPLAPGK